MIGLPASVDPSGLRPEAVKERALVLFESGYNCAETFVVAFAGELGADEDIMRFVTPFGAGIGGRRDLCGMITGGALVIGLVYGRTDPADLERKTEVYRRSAKYYRWFKTERQLKCSEIVTGKFTGHTGACVSLMIDAIDKLAEILREPPNQGAER